MPILKVLLMVMLTSCFSTTKVKLDKPAMVIPPQEFVETYHPFYFKSSIKWVGDVSMCANMIINDSKFREELMAIKKFDMSSDNGEYVLKKLQSGKTVIKTYKTRNPFSKAVATTWKSNKTDIYLNIRKKRTIAQWSGTAIHESSHNRGYSHGNNSSAGKEKTVPYLVGTIATKHAKRICD